MKKKILFIILVFVLVFCISPKFVLAEEDDYGTYCKLCVHRDSDDPLFKKERQFYKKVKIISDTYGNSIDTTALTFAVLHRYTGPDIAYEREYDNNFDENEYKGRNSFLKSNYGSTDLSSLDAQDLSLVIQNEKYDLLTLAALVMVDSNKNGEYSDVCFMDGLSGNRLVGNNNSSSLNPIENFFQDITNNVINFLTCYNELQRGTDSYIGDSSKVRSASENLRVNNLKNVCQNGYIGGLFNGVKEISDEEKKTQQKKVIAQQIIDKANYYRKMYGSDEASSGGTCPVGSISGNTQIKDLKGKSLEERIEIVGPIAQAAYSQTGIFASVTIAQSIGESGIGVAYENDHRAEYNNMIGVMCDGGKGVRGHECKSGFTVYSNIEDSFVDRDKLFNADTYPGCREKTTPEDFINCVIPIYAPVSDGNRPTYGQELIDLINKYNLKKWDVKTNVSSNGSCIGTSSVSGWNVRKNVPTSSDNSFTEFEKSNGSSNRGQCVWYAKGRSFEILNDLKDKSTINDSQANAIKKLVLGIAGNGGDIYDNAKDKFNTSNDIKKPKAGSFIVWKKKGDYGHVAVVEEVTDTNITVIGGYTSTGSCPDNWGCIKLEQKTMSLDEFYNGYGKNYNGGYEFDGYVYFLEPKGSDMPSISNSPSSSADAIANTDGDAKFGSSKEYVCLNGKAVKKGSNCFGNVDVNSEEYQRRLGELHNYYQGSGKAKDIPVNGVAFAGVGCGTASIMAAYYMYTGEDFDVNKFVNDSIAQGYLSAAGSNSELFYTPTGTKLITDNWGIYGERLERNIDSIINALSQGKKVLFNVYPNSSTNWPTNAGHYILFDHYNKNTNEIYIFDPVGAGHRNKYFSVDMINSQLLNNMNHDPVAISINGEGDSGSCGDKKADLSSVVECAKKQLGKEYVHAEHGPDKFDCSGLTYYCYKEALGVDITAGSYEQWNDTEHFTNVDSIDKLVPGDIIASRGGGHVSIYIGNGQVIHASNPSVGVIQSDASSHTEPILYKHYKGG